MSSLIEKDQALIWHPFTQMKSSGLPIAITRGEGVYIYDEEDRRILDAVSSWWVCLHGHAHPYLAQKIYEQLMNLEHVIFAGFTHPPAVELAERLLKILPQNQARLFWSDNGSTAVEVAIKMCIQYFHNKGIHRKRIISFHDAYHGDTFGAMSAGGPSAFNAPFADFLFEVEHIPTPIPGKEAESLEALDKALAKGDVCAFMFEPLVLGAGGMMMYEPEVLDEMMGRCKKADVLCIADEVMTGFGRTGRLFASLYLENTPDVMCLSKGLTGGVLPMSLTTCTEAIFEAFLSDDKMKTFFHGHSFTGNPVGCAAALASLDLLLKEETLAQIQMIEKSHHSFIDKIKDHPNLTNIRMRGTILALDFVDQGGGYFSNIRDQLYEFFLERNILLRPLGNVIYILPPLVINANQLQEIYQAIKEALDFFGNKN